MVASLEFKDMTSYSQFERWGASDLAVRLDSCVQKRCRYGCPKRIEEVVAHQMRDGNDGVVHTKGLRCVPRSSKWFKREQAERAAVKMLAECGGMAVLFFAPSSKSQI